MSWLWRKSEELSRSEELHAGRVERGRFWQPTGICGAERFERRPGVSSAVEYGQARVDTPGTCPYRVEYGQARSVAP